MAQITWRNIQAPNFSSSMLGTEAAGDRLSKVFNPLEQALKDKVAMDDENYDNTTKNINMAIRDRIGQVGGLGELNQLGEQGLLDQARQQFGTRISEEDLRAGFANQQGILQDRAVDESLPGAYAAGDKTLRSSDSGSALYQSLLDLNVKPSDAMSRTSDFMKNNTFKERLYKEAKDAELEERVSNTPTPTSNEQVNEFVAQAVKDGFRGDPDALRSRYMQEAGGFLADESNRNAQEERSYIRKQRAEKEQLDIALASSIAAVNAGGDVNAIVAQYRDLSGSAKIQLYGGLKSYAIDKQKLFPAQELEAKKMDVQNNRELSSLEKAHGSIITSKEKNLAKVSGISERDLEVVRGFETGKEGIVIALSKEAKDGHVMHFSTFSGDKDGNAAVAAIQAPYMNLLAQDIPEDVAGAIALKAYRDVSDKVRSGILGQSVIPAKAYAEAVNARAKQYLDAEDLRSDLTNTKNQSTHEIEAARSTAAEMGINFLQQTMRSNSGGAPVTRESIEAGVKKDTPASLSNLVDSSPLYIAYKADEATKAEAKAKEALLKKQKAAEAKQNSIGVSAQKSSDKYDSESLLLQKAISRYKGDVIGTIGSSKFPLIRNNRGYLVEDNGGLRKPTTQEQEEIMKMAFTGKLQSSGSSLDLSNLQMNSEEVEALKAQMRKGVY